jgi:hypothetical protein
VALLTFLFAAVAATPARDIDLVRARVPGAPSFAGSPLPPAAPRPATRLILVSSRPVKPTDTEQAWQARNGLDAIRLEAPNSDDTLGGNSLSDVPRDFRGAPLQQAIIQPRGAALLVYGAGPASTSAGGGRFVFRFDPTNRSIRYGFDFDRFAYPTQQERQYDTNGFGFTRQGVLWAEEQNGILYVATAYNGYARESNGRNAYVTAVRVADGRIIWRSPPLVASANNFLMRGDVIVCGYGFTDEKDFLYVLDRRTGRIVQRVALKSAPEHLRLKGDRVYVRCYDMDYVFRLKG